MISLLPGHYSCVSVFCLALLFYASQIVTITEASCYKHGILLNCINKIPDSSDFTSSKLESIQISNYEGDLTIDLPPDKNVHLISSVQIFNSTIHRIAPRYFADISGGSLQTLTLNAARGDFHLDAQTLGGLENVLQTLRVSVRTLGDISYFAELKKLTTLYLGLTELTEVPENFGTVISRVIAMDLSKNKLTRLPWDALARRIQNVEVSRIRLANNPWHCDCSLRPLLELPAEQISKITGFECATPSGVAGFTLTEFQAANLCKPLPAEELNRENESNEKGVFEGVDEYPIRDESTARRSSIIKPGESVDPDIQEGTHEEIRPNVNTEVASAGLSTEVIAVIVAIVVKLTTFSFSFYVFSSSAVIEHPSPPRGTSGGPKSGVSGTNNNYTRDVDHVERQPLAPGYRDNRL
ncbi:hypothetical protein FBUS_03436 [Fasciolopsis buskii]|uniref:LRRCT domain-containing protein n=1 Tax=Fasciolopsis buskii TaxID=27845 RepID=A0A8E0VCT0_9TREM|nr:hypothetical protein FBUS_03436 [Fasciolopsis buski]